MQAWQAGQSTAEPWPNPETVAAGLRVPRPYGGFLILNILQQSRGAAVAVTDDEIMQALKHWARIEGVFAAPRGAASLTAYRQLCARPNEAVVLFSTGADLSGGDRELRQAAATESAESLLARTRIWTRISMDTETRQTIASVCQLFAFRLFAHLGTRRSA